MLEFYYRFQTRYKDSWKSWLQYCFWYFCVKLLIFFLDYLSLDFDIEFCNIICVVILRLLLFVGPFCFAFIDIIILVSNMNTRKCIVYTATVFVQTYWLFQIWICAIILRQFYVRVWIHNRKISRPITCLIIEN